MQVIGSLCWLLLVVPAAEDLSPLTAREGVPVVPYDQAQDYIGQDCLVYGTVVQTRNIGSRCFLNFHTDYTRYFTVVINQADFHKSPYRRRTSIGSRTSKCSATSPGTGANPRSSSPRRTKSRS